MSETPARRSWSARALIALVRAAYYQPWLVIGLGILLCVGSLWLSYAHLEFQTDRAALVDDNERFKQLAENFNEEFPNNDDIVVVVDGGQKSEREKFVDQLGARLESQPQYFKNVFWLVKLPFLKTHALLYLDRDDLEKIVSALRQSKGMMTALSSQKGVGEMLSQSTKDMANMLPILNEVLGQLLAAVNARGTNTYNSPFQKAFFEGAAEKASEHQEIQGEEFYNTLADGTKHLLVLRYVDDVAVTIEHLHAEIRRLKPSFPDIDVGITGESVLDLDEMESSIHDSTRATLWSLVLVSIMFAFAFQKITRPLMALFALLLGLGWTLGFTTIAIGHLNLLTVTFATILVGLGADFGIHSIYRYEEERARGQGPLWAMETCIEQTGLENLTGAVTTAVAFWAIRFTDFRGVAELGMIAGTGVMLCFLAMATVLPALIFLQERRHSVAVEPRPGWAAPLAAAEELLLSHPWLVIAACSLFSVWCLTKLPVTFDYNLLHLQSNALPSVQTELRLIHSAENSKNSHGVLMAVALADSLEEAKRKEAAFKKLPSVSAVESVTELIPPDYPAKIPVVKALQSLMEDVPLPDPNGPRDAGTRNGLMEMGEGFTQLDAAFKAAYPILIKDPDPEVREQAQRFKDLLNTLFTTLEHLGPGVIADSVEAFQHDLFGDLRGILEFLKAQRAEPPVTFQLLPKEVAVRSIGKSGKILLRVYPKHDVWERENLTPFVTELQSVDPDIIGTPIMVYYHTEALKRAYEVSGYYALSAIVVLLLLHFRAVGTTCLALFPKLVGVLWMLGLMSYYHVQFNPANFMALPLILGIGLIFGVHVVHRLIHDPRAGIFSHSTGPAIALSAMTTMIGFGTLMMARHQGISSLGFLMTVGVGANLVTSLIFLPAVMKVLSKPKPLTFKDPEES